MNLTVPPPLDPSVWVNNTSLNYTALHEEFADVLVCLYIPVGLFGFYVWVATLVLMFASAIDSYMFLGKETSKTIIPTALLCGTFSVFMLVLDVLTIMDCSNMRGYDVVRPEVGLSMTALALNALGDISVIYNPGKRRKITSFVCFSTAALILAVSGPVYFASVVMTAPVEWPWERFDAVKKLPMLAAILPGLVLNFILLATSFLFLLGIKTLPRFDTSRFSRSGTPNQSDTESQGASAISNDRQTPMSEQVRSKFDRIETKGLCQFLIYVATGQLILLVYYCSAIGNIFLGKVVGDTWGGYFIQKVIGKVLAGAAGFFPMAQVGVLFVSFFSG